MRVTRADNVGHTTLDTYFRVFEKRNLQQMMTQVSLMLQEASRVGGDLKMMVEKFSLAELSALRNELMQNGLDPWQAAELFHVFLSGRGYGVSSNAAIDAATRVEESGCSIDVLQHELESLAMVM
ncbi:MAG TPA: hypothetical protein VJR04_03320 [Terriglobales bacterium]|nr:hypothetical protein [Terriglobales bacterium]